MSPAQGSSSVPPLNKKKHVTYWLRCLRTCLPSGYTEYDSQRMTLAFFILSALDLLSVLDESVTIDLKDRRDYVDWIYSCQHQDGGFLPYPSLRHNGQDLESANLAATFFALAALIVLDDDLSKFNRDLCWTWTRKLQLQNGSFAEGLNRDGSTFGGSDVRYCYLAAGTRWILQHLGAVPTASDIDTALLAQFVRSSMAYEGGIGKAPLHEAHAGWTFCGIGTLKLLASSATHQEGSGELEAWLQIDEDIQPGLVQWLTARQTFNIDGEPDLSNISDVSTDAAHIGLAGFSGRCNKVADTCYSFWVGASLAMLDHAELQDTHASQIYLLAKTQHVIGGFGKSCGDPPDILHAYLGLAALAIMDHADVREVDPVLCISKRTLRNFCERAAR